ncbi:hypothetical protein D3C81_1348240 [compost metagenome]
MFHTYTSNHLKLVILIVEHTVNRRRFFISIVGQCISNSTSSITDCQLEIRIFLKINPIFILCLIRDRRKVIIIIEAAPLFVTI